MREKYAAQQPKRGTGLFMTELILVILFFSIASSCCLQAFAKASRMERKSEQLKVVLNSTENLVQQLKAADGRIEDLNGFYPKMSSGEQAEIYFDRDGGACPADEADYVICLRTKIRNGLLYADLVSSDQEGTEIYSLEAALFPVRQMAAAE